jgi:F-type H+-transporting ATPase subunit beta
MWAAMRSFWILIVTFELADTVRGFREIAEGKHDGIPEQAFYMQGGIDDVMERAETFKATA